MRTRRSSGRERRSNVGERIPRVVTVVRRTAYESLLERHATRGQAQFFLATRGEGMDRVETAHRRVHEAIGHVLTRIPPKWRRAPVDRRGLDRYLFERDDVLVAVGQGGLVANVAKYLRGQPVIGINPLPDEYDGILAPHPPKAAPALITAAGMGRARLEQRTMVEAELDDGQRLLALNEIFVGHRTHQSARYQLAVAGRHERHSSSGLIVATGTGATGWARSINLSRGSAIALPSPSDARLAFFVREAFPSVATGTELTYGLIDTSQRLEVVSEMNESGVLFGDGIEDDRLQFGWGQVATLRVASMQLALVAPTGPV